MTVVFSRVAIAILLTTCVVAIGSTQEVAGPTDSPIFVKVTQDREIAGLPLDLAEIKVTTGFGEVTIPMAKIVGLKFHADGQDSAVIAFKNGDLVTGKISLEVIKVKTEWGTAHVNTTQIDAIAMSRNAQFYSEANGGGWRFSNASTIPVQSSRSMTIPLGRRN